MYTITLADGKKLEGLSLNGTNFVSDTKIDESIFTDNLSTMTIFDGETETVLHDVEFIQQVHYADGWYFCFREIPQQEKVLTALQKAAEENENDLTDVQIALAEIYELIIGGM